MKRLVKEILQDKGSEVVTIDSSKTVFTALSKMSEANIGAVVVNDNDGQMVGIFTERDYARKVVKNTSASLDATVAEYMTEIVSTVGLEQTVDECMALMTDQRFRHLPVLDDNRLCGLISIGDLVKASLEEKEFLIKQLTEYIQYP